MNPPVVAEIRGTTIRADGLIYKSILVVIRLDQFTIPIESNDYTNEF